MAQKGELGGGNDRGNDDTYVSYHHQCEHNVNKQKVQGSRVYIQLIHIIMLVLKHEMCIVYVYHTGLH